MELIELNRGNEIRKELGLLYEARETLENNKMKFIRLETGTNRPDAVFYNMKFTNTVKVLMEIEIEEDIKKLQSEFDCL